MLGQVYKADYLDLNPIRTYSRKKQRHTTITSFQKVLTTCETGISESGFRISRKSSNGVQVAKSPSVSKSNVSITTAQSMKKTDYDKYFAEAAKKYDVPVSLLKGMAKAESDFNPNVTSNAGAAGIMQLMPATAKAMGVNNVYDPEQNILGGAKYIAQKIKEFNGNVKLALAAYNAGSGTVRRCGGIPSACRTYINKVLSYKEAYETAKKA